MKRKKSQLPGVTQSISNLQMAVRMTLIEQASRNQPNAADPQFGLTQDKMVDCIEGLGADPLEEEKGENMEFLLPIKHDEIPNAQEEEIKEQADLS